MLRTGAVLVGGGLASRGTGVRPVAAANGDGWPTQRFDPANTAYNPDGSPLTGDVAVHAKIDAVVGFSQDYLLTDGTAYVNDTENGDVGALDLETGEVRWTANPADEPAIPQFVEEGVLATRALNGTIYGLNRDSGDVTSEIDVGRGVGLGYSGGGQWFAPTEDGLVAGQGGSDDYQWTTDLDGVVIRPAVDGQRLYLPVLEGVAPDEVNVQNPSEMDGAGRLYAIDVADGSVVWEVSSDGFGLTSPTVAGGSVYWPRADGSLTAYDSGTGDEQWQFTAEAGFNAPIAVTGNSVVAGNDDGRLYGLDPNTGEEYGSVQTEGRVRGGPVVVGDTAFFGTDAHTVYAFDLDSAETIWQLETDGPVRALTAGYGRVVAGTMSGTYVIGANDEAPLDGGTSGDASFDGQGEATESESADERGFLTNDPDSSLAFLDDPVTLTWAGIGVSIAGIVMQLFGRQT